MMAFLLYPALGMASDFVTRQNEKYLLTKSSRAPKDSHASQTFVTTTVLIRKATRYWKDLVSPD